MQISGHLQASTALCTVFIVEDNECAKYTCLEVAEKREMISPTGYRTSVIQPAARHFPVLAVAVHRNAKIYCRVLVTIHRNWIGNSIHCTRNYKLL
jgi:hypothetical protein